MQQVSGKSDDSPGDNKTAVFHYLDKEGFILLYNTYASPYLEYCIQAWTPYSAKDIQCLEKVQKRSTKMAFGLKHLNYEKRLDRLGQFSLEHRRKKGDMIEAYQILSWIENVDPNTFFTGVVTGGIRGIATSYIRKAYGGTAKTFSQLEAD